MPNSPNVLIVGGGIAGMALGIALGRAGIGTEIVELNPLWTAKGMGISLQGPALRSMAVIGVLEECVKLGYGYSQFKACDARGNISATVDLPRLNGPVYPATVGIMRHTLHSILKEALVAAHIPVRLGVTVTSLQQNDKDITAEFDDGTSGAYRLVVGADGANSKIRDLAFGRKCEPEYTGQAVWRATVRRPQEVQARISFYGQRSKAGFNPVSETQMYIYLQQTLPDFVRVSEDQLPALMRELLDEFGGLLAAAREEISSPDQIVYRPVTSHILAVPWHRGRVIVIGDAAHTVTPQLAAGAGLAMEDSVVLASVLSSGVPLQHALENFMSRRYDRCRMVVDNSRQLAEWEKNPNASDADHVGLPDKTLTALARPI